MNKRLIALFACLVPFALIAAGCGSSDNTESTATALTKAEFLKQGNAICAKGNEEIEEEFETFVKKSNLKKSEEPSNAEKEEIAENILIPKIQQQIDGIRALGAPEGEEEQVEEILDAAEEALNKVEEDPVAFISEENNQAFEKVNQLSREYGLTVCGEEEGEEGQEQG